MTDTPIPEVVGAVHTYLDGDWYAEACTVREDPNTLIDGCINSPLRPTREQAEADIPRVVAALRTALENVAAGRLPALLPECEDNDHANACIDRLRAELEAARAVSVALMSDNAALRAELAAMRPVVEAAVEWYANPSALGPISKAVDTYLTAKEARDDKD